MGTSRAQIGICRVSYNVCGHNSHIVGIVNAKIAVVADIVEIGGVRIKISHGRHFSRETVTAGKGQPLEHAVVLGRKEIP